MADQSKLTLPGDFEAGKTYLLAGETLIAWRKALLADRVVAGDGLVESGGGPTGRIFKATAQGGGGAGAAAGAFSRVYTDGDGNTMLQGGTVQGGTGTPEVVADFELLAAAGTPPADGTHVSISIDVTANEDDDVLVPGCSVTSASISEGDPGAASIPTDGSPSGSVDLSLGQWTGGVFQPSGPAGNIIVVHYLGTLLIERA